MSGHTPGPWRVIPRDKDGRAPAVVRGREGGFVVCGLSAEREDADARLIAAAPELLKSLTELEAQAQQQNDAYGKPSSPSMHAALTSARAVIAKATGASA